MKNARIHFSLLALALCALGSQAQAQNESESSRLALTASPVVSATTQRSQDSNRSSARSPVRQSSRPTARPSTNQRPAARPTTQRPATRPAAQRPTSRPATQRPTSRPAPQRPTTQPPTQRPTTQPAAQRPTSRPAPQRPTTRPTSQPDSRRTSAPSGRPITTPDRSQPTSRVNDRTSTPSRNDRTAPVQTTDPRSRNAAPRTEDSGQTPNYTPRTSRPVVPRASDSTALQRARERARSTSQPRPTAPNQPTTAQRIQRDRLQRAQAENTSKNPVRTGSGFMGTDTRARTTTPLDKERLSAGATRIQAARERIRKNSESGSKTRVTHGSGIQQGSGANPDRGIDSRSSADRRLGAVKGDVQVDRAQARIQDTSRLKSMEARRIKTARKDYLDSRSRGAITSGRVNPRPNLNNASAQRPGSITAGAGRGASITAGSGHSRNLWQHNDYSYRHAPYSNYYWNWSVWGSGYGWFWCPAQWATACWWDAYWYSGGYWNYGYRPSFYYCGPFTPPTYTVIVQVNDEPDVVQELPSQPAAQVAEAVAPPPQVAPAINRAAEYYLTLGDRAFRSGRYSDAVHHYGKAVEYSPNEGILYLILSDALFATGDYHYGAFTLRKALDLDPSLVDLTVDKRSFYDRPADLDAQMTRARTFYLQNPGDEDARLMLIANELFVGNPSAALSLLDQPESHATLQTNAGILLQERARLDVERARQASEAQTPDPVFEVTPLQQN